MAASSSILPAFGIQPVTFPGGPPNQPTSFGCDAERVVPAGGALAAHLLHPSVKPFERIYRKQATLAIYNASRQRPSRITLGAFKVPRSMVLALQGALVRPYRFDPIVAGDAMPLAPGRLALSLAFDLTIDVVGRPGNIEAELIPGDPEAPTNVDNPVTPASMVGFPDLPSKSLYGDNNVLPPTAYSGSNVTVAQPDLISMPAEATPVPPGMFVLGASGGGAVTPLTPSAKQGPDDMPFTYLAYEGEAVTLTAVAFGPIRIPLAFIEGVLTGYLLPKTWLDALLQRMMPCSQ